MDRRRGLVNSTAMNSPCMSQKEQTESTSGTTDMRGPHLNKQILKKPKTVTPTTNSKAELPPDANLVGSGIIKILNGPQCFPEFKTQKQRERYQNGLTPTSDDEEFTRLVKHKPEQARRIIQMYGLNKERFLRSPKRWAIPQTCLEKVECQTSDKHMYDLCHCQFLNDDFVRSIVYHLTRACLPQMSPVHAYAMHVSHTCLPHNRWSAHWMMQFKTEGRNVYVINSVLWNSVVDFEKGKILNLKKLLKKGIQYRLIPKDFLQTGGIICAPLNIPWRMHWMLIVILCHDKNKNLIIVRAYNSLFKHSWQKDPTTLKVMANVVEHILVHRGVPGTVSPAHTCLPHIHVSRTCLPHIHVSRTYMSPAHTCLPHIHVSLPHMSPAHTTCLPHIHVSRTYMSPAHTCLPHIHVSRTYMSTAHLTYCR